MHIVFEIKGKQYSLKEKNQIIHIDYQKNSKLGEEIVFDKVLSMDNQFGQPYLSNTKITGEIIKHCQKKPITVFKYKRKKRYKKRPQSARRARYTMIKITEITGI